MKRKHVMPFGAEIGDDRTVRFRLWAPKASSVALQLRNPDRALPMSRGDEGWFELVTEFRAGTQYNFKIDEQHSVPDPASRLQPSGVHGQSEVIDPFAYYLYDGIIKSWLLDVTFI